LIYCGKGKIEGLDKTGKRRQPGLQFCNQLFAIEHDLKDKSPEDRYTIRQEQSLPVLDTPFATS